MEQRLALRTTLRHSESSWVASLPSGSCKDDATTLAHLLRLDYLPTAYIPPR